MQNDLVSIGIFLVFVGFILVIIGGLSGKSESKVAFVGLIGPFPFGFGNDKRLFAFALGFAVFMLVLWFVFRKQF